MNATKLDLIPEIPSTLSLRHSLKDWDISGPQVTPDTLGQVIAILSWVFLDMWDVKYRSQVVAGEAASDLSAIALSRTNNRYS